MKYVFAPLPVPPPAPPAPSVPVHCHTACDSCVLAFDKAMASADRVAVDVKPNYGSIPLDPPADPPPVRGKAGPLATGFNVVNVYLGLGLLAQAYALQRGGWVALVLMGVCCAMCAYTGQLVVACFRAMQERTVCARDAGWADLAEYVLGTRGKWLVFGIALVEAFGAGCMALLMLWRNLEGLMPKVPSLQIELWTLIAIVPALFAQVLASVFGQARRPVHIFLLCARAVAGWLGDCSGGQQEDFGSKNMAKFRLGMTQTKY